MHKPQYVRKKRTGALWCSRTPGVWRKEDLGMCFSATTKPVGYVTNQFDPTTRRNQLRFEKVYC